MVVTSELKLTVARPIYKIPAGSSFLAPQRHQLLLAWRNNGVSSHVVGWINQYKYVDLIVMLEVWTLLDASDR